MSILKYKYQAHKLINYIFYIIVFAIGFIVGFTSKNIDINKLISNVLFIDNVKAYNYESVTSNTIVNETYILNLFKNKWNDYNFSDFPYITCSSSGTTYSRQGNDYVITDEVITCYAFPSNIFDITSFTMFSQYNVIMGGQTNFNIYKLSYSLTNELYNNFQFYQSTNVDFIVKDYNPVGIGNHSVNPIGNFSIDVLSESDNNNFNVLDFDTSNLEFNSDLFANNPDFKEVCVNNTDTFLISSNEDFGGQVLADYIWFPYGLRGLEQGVFYTKDNSLEFNYETEMYFFNSTSIIDDTFEETGLPFTLYNYSYEDRYNYFGWTAVPFIITYDDDVNDYMFYTFRFKNTVTEIRLSEGEFLVVPNVTEDIEWQNGESCFYINKAYEVQTLDEYNNGDYHGTITTPYGDINIYSINENSFFTRFSKEDFGLSAIVSAPLKTILKISNGVCTPYSIPLFNKNITIPCGNTVFWDRQDVQGFKTFWNMFWGGILCYGIGVSLFRLVYRLRDPLNDKIEVIDL